MKKFFRYAIYIIIGGGLIYVLVRVILAGYPISWTGFGEYDLPNGEIVQAKKLWDWMELLIIPSVLASGALFLNRSEQITERKSLKDRQREAALQAYLDRMSDLLIDEKLRTTNIKAVQDVARTRTLSVLRGLDGIRKAQVIKFLYEAKLIDKDDVIVNLANSDLTYVFLSNAILTGVNLTGANLDGAYLDYAALNDANLSHTTLLRANLKRANLRNTNLNGAMLFNAKLNGAFLEGADLTTAVLVDANLRRAYYNSLTRWPDWFDPKAAGLRHA